jgi:[ribosomal protein S18]-alanine N-acetyltransferase
MLEFKIFRNEEELNKVSSREEYIDFLYKHLDRFRDDKDAINRAINYAFSDAEGKGGFLLSAYHEGKLVGELLMIDTGMKAFIPENILVYIAVDAQYRGKGFGREIIKESAKHCTGDIKLHVEYDNPAKRLYERIGFESKYAEMRYVRSE